MKQLLLIILFAGSILEFNAQSSFELHADREEILIGEQIKLTLVVKALAADTIALPYLEDTLRKEIEILKIRKPDTAFAGPSLMQKQIIQEVLVTGFDSGYFPIKPLEAIVNGDTIQSNPILISVQTIQIDTAKGIADIKDIVEVPFSWKEWFQKYGLWIGVGIAAALLILYLILLWRRRKPKDVEYVPAAPSISPSEKAFARLAELKSNELWQNNKIKEYYSELTDILREYIEDQFEIPALEQTSDEIILSMRHHADFNEEQIRKTKRLLFLADLVKFAKANPLASDNEAHFEAVEGFVRSTSDPADPTPENPQTEHNG